MGYKLSTGEKDVWDARLGEPFPQCVIDRIEAGEVFCAHNCQFEKAVFKYILDKIGVPMPKYWLDTMAVCAYRSIPLGLDKAGEVLNLDIVKDKRGKYLISRLSSPRKPLKADKDLFELMGLSEGEWPTLYVEDDELHQEFKDYCIRDVDTEEELSRVLGDLPIQEYKIWLLDQEINERGLTVDVESVKAAKRLADQVSQQLTLELIDVTNGVVRSGNQNAVMLEWLQERGYGYDDLRKDTVEKSLDDETLDPEVRRVLELRQQLSKASTKKLDKFIQCVNSDGKIRGLLQYHGAGTGRWAGRLVQPQNMPRGTIDADNVFEVLHMPDAKEVIEMVLGDPLEAISSSLRGMLTASEGNDLYVADFSAIEARVLAWLAGEEKMLEVFYAYDAGTGPDVYCSMAAEIYNKPVNKKDNPKERQLGKIGVLGCGYQMGPGALQAQAEASYKVILDEDTAKLIVNTYRTTYSKVTSFWYDTEDAAIKAVELGVPVQAGKVVWETVTDTAGYWLTATLPNGKRLWYLEPKIDWIDFFGKRKKSLSYAGKDNKKGGSWGRVRTYGGMLVENVTQAFARELMADAMFRTEAEGFASVLSVHDEIVSDGPKGMDMKLFERTMAGPNPDWAKGCPVEVEGMVTRRYRK